MEKILEYDEFLELNEGINISPLLKKIFKYAGGFLFLLLSVFGVSLAIAYSKNKKIVEGIREIINKQFSDEEMEFIKTTLENDRTMIQLNQELRRLAVEYDNAVSKNAPPVILHDISKKNKVISDAVTYRKIQIFGPDIVKRMNIVEHELKMFLEKNNMK